MLYKLVFNNKENEYHYIISIITQKVNKTIKAVIYDDIILSPKLLQISCFDNNNNNKIFIMSLHVCK